MSNENQKKEKKPETLGQRLLWGFGCILIGALGLALAIWAQGQQTGFLYRSYTGILMFSLFLIACGVMILFPKKKKK